MASKSAKRRKARKPAAPPPPPTAASILAASTSSERIESPYGSGTDRAMRRKDIIRDMGDRGTWDRYQVAAAERYRRSWDIVRAGGPRCGERVGGGTPGMGESEAVLAAACDLRQARAEIGATVAAALDLVLGEGETITTAASRVVPEQLCIGAARTWLGTAIGMGLSSLAEMWRYRPARQSILSFRELTAHEP
ncbi:hypothetical protein ACRC7T_13985 [Segnochrobactraceae bacterium EtOH-i3]